MQSPLPGLLVSIAIPSTVTHFRSAVFIKRHPEFHSSLDFQPATQLVHLCPLPLVVPFLLCRHAQRRTSSILQPSIHLVFRPASYSPKTEPTIKMPPKKTANVEATAQDGGVTTTPLAFNGKVPTENDMKFFAVVLSKLNTKIDANWDEVAAALSRK